MATEEAGDILLSIQIPKHFLNQKLEIEVGYLKKETFLTFFEADALCQKKIKKFDLNGFVYRDVINANGSTIFLLHTPLHLVIILLCTKDFNISMFKI